jgi:hypothetical protein
MGARIGAGTYLLSMCTAVNVYCLVVVALYYYGIVPKLIDVVHAQYIISALGVVVGALYFYLSQRRLQDLNVPGIWAKILAFPLFGVMFLPLLCFLSAPRLTNRFGRPPLPSGGLKVCAALASFGAALVLVPFVATLYRPLHLH